MQLENELRKAEMEFNVEMKKLSVEEEKLSYQDTASARDREVKIQTSEYGTWLGKNVSSLLALGTTVLVFILFYFVIFKPDKLIFSKIDESLSLGNIFNLKMKTEVPVAYFTTGQRVPEDIEIAYPRKFARKVFLDYNSSGEIQ